MGALIGIGIWALVAFVVYKRFKRTMTRSRRAGQKFELMPANAAAILGMLAFIPGLWILKVEGWTERFSIDIATGHTSSTSTLGSQLARAAAWFAVGAVLLFTARTLGQKQTRWPPAVQQLIERLGLAARRAPNPSPRANAPVSDSVSRPLRFNPPPTWPATPPGWTPSPDWEPDPAWPPAPPGWQFWIDDLASAHIEEDDGIGATPLTLKRQPTRVKLLVGACVLVAVLVGMYAWFMRGEPDGSHVVQALRDRSDMAYLFKSDGSPRFHVTSSKEPEPGWYVAKLKLDDVETEENTVVLRQQGSSDKQLTVVAGPGTDFPNECRSSIIPIAVHKVICYS